MDTAFLQSAAFWGWPLFPVYEKTVGIPVRMGCVDPLGPASPRPIASS